MEKRMETRDTRRLLSLVLSMVMVLSLLPVPSFAAEGDGLCAHHPAHTPECGYVAAVAGHDCGHQHDESCGYATAGGCTHSHDESCGYREVSPCTHQHTEECGEDGASCTHVHDDSCGYQEAADCGHQHDESCGHREASDCGHAHDESCGYVEAVAGQPCGYVCTQCAYTGWVEEDGNWYYLVDGVRQTGWQNSIPGWEGKWFYFDTETGVMQTGWKTGIPGSEGNWYYFDSVTGEMQTGWQNDIPDYEGKWFYFDPATGVMQTDLQGSVPDYVGAWYYLDPTTGAIQTGGVQNGGVQGRSQSQCGTFNGSPADVDANGNLLINETNFPDGKFRGIVADYDTDKDGSLSVAEVAAVNKIDCVFKSISSLKGIEYFTALTKLYCAQNQLTSLDVSKNTALTFLNCYFNQLTSLDVSSNTKLTTLVCQGNQLTSLNVSSNTELTKLYCGDNQLTSLDVSRSTALTNLTCGNNKLASLDLSHNTSLSSTSFVGQTPTGRCIQQDGKCLFDLGKLVGSGNLSRVSNVTGGTYDSTTGMVTLDAPTNGEATFQYNYDTKKGSMGVTLTLTAHTHSFDENGDCACGLVKQVPYVNAQGKAQTPQVCTILTGDTTTLSAGWYVAQGDVTIGTEEAPQRVTVSGDVKLILADGCNLIVNGGIQVEGSNALTLYAQSTTEATMGKLTTQNVNGMDAAIGGSSGGSGGTITINGGIIQAYGSAERSYGAAIGGGFGDNGGSGGEITINGGIVNAKSFRGAAIGGGFGEAQGGSGGTITINGGVVQAMSDQGAAIGGGGSLVNNGSSGSFSTGTSGNAVIFASSKTVSIADQSKKSSWSGMIFEGQTGKVYGSPTLSLGLPIPDGKRLSLNLNSNSLSFAQGTGITLGRGSTLKLSGPGTFPNGISVSGGALGDLLAEGWAFTQGGKYVPVSGVSSLSEETRLSSITITSTTQPTDVTITYGDKASLSVTAEPVTSGDTVTYQWYLDGSALTGQTQSTLSLSTLNAGTHQIYCAVTCGGFTVDSSTAKVTVNKAQGSVTITGDPSKTYDGQPVALTDTMYSTTGGTGKVEYKVKGAADSTYTTTAPKDAGNYTVRVTAEDANHTAASETRDFTITPKTVTLTVTVKDKTFDETTSAEIDTATLNGIVEGDKVSVVNGTATFAKSTPGADIPVSFTAFSLTGTDAGNYALTQPTGVTGRILASVNYLDLTGNADFAKQTEVWVDGVKYPVDTENGCYVNLPASGDLLTVYTYKKGNSDASHVNYPTSMTVYRINRRASGATLTKISAFDDLLQYSGCSIRITGKRGIRMITSLDRDIKQKLTTGNLAGYTLEEYGTVIQWADTLNGKDLTLNNGKHNYAYKRGKADPVFNATENLTQYTNVLVDFSLAQCKKDIVMRPYIILKGTDGKQVTLYGGSVSRSIGYIAYQNRSVFQPGTAAYAYVWDIIHAVYGKTYDKDYKGT